MKYLYLDSASLKDINEAIEIGVISGITTNPTLISKEPKSNYEKLIDNIFKITTKNKLSLSVEVFSNKYEGMIKEALLLHKKYGKKNKKFHVKIPVNIDGIKAINFLNKKKIRTNATACYNEQQLQSAILAGANYVSLFYCRSKSEGNDVKKILSRTHNFINSNKSLTKIIAGSIRTKEDISDAWEYGSDIVTTSIENIKLMCENESSNRDALKFIQDFKYWKEN